jgi:hypothetical protein
VVIRMEASTTASTTEVVCRRPALMRLHLTKENTSNKLNFFSIQYLCNLKKGNDDVIMFIPVCTQ